MRASPDVQIEAGGAAYTLRFSAKALAALQDCWGLSDLDAVATKLTALDSGAVTMADYTEMLWAALRTHHRDVTKEVAFDLLDDMGLPAFEAALGAAMGASSAEGGGDASANPPNRGRSPKSSNSAAK